MFAHLHESFHLTIVRIKASRIKILSTNEFSIYTKQVPKLLPKLGQIHPNDHGKASFYSVLVDLETSREKKKIILRGFLLFFFRRKGFLSKPI